MSDTKVYFLDGGTLALDAFHMWWNQGPGAGARGRMDELKHGQTVANTTFETVEGDFELARGVHMIFTPGHTVGHYSCMVERANDRPMMLVLDAACTKRSLDTLCQASLHLDPAAGVRSMLKIRELAARHDAELFFSHNIELFKTYRTGADYYS